MATVTSPERSVEEREVLFFVEDGWELVSKIRGSDFLHGPVELDAAVLQPEGAIAVAQGQIFVVCGKKQDFCLLKHLIQPGGGFHLEFLQ